MSTVACHTLCPPSPRPHSLTVSRLSAGLRTLRLPTTSRGAETAKLSANGHQKVL